MGYILLNHWPKVSYANAKATQTVAMSIDCPLPTDDKALKATLTHVIEVNNQAGD